MNHNIEGPKGKIELEIVVTGYDEFIKCIRDIEAAIDSLTAKFEKLNVVSGEFNSFNVTHNHTAEG